MTDLVEVRRGAFYDSVSLMQVSKAVREALASTLAIGHSSGADLVAGLTGSLRVLEESAHPSLLHGLNERQNP